MRILLDDTPCEFSADTIGTAIEQATEHAHSIGRVIIQVEVDGRMFDPEDFENAVTLGNRPDEMAFKSLSPDELLLATLELGESAIEAAQSNFERAAELIQSGETDRALGELKQGIDLWKTVEETVFREAIPEIPGQGMELEEHVAELSKSLDSIRKAMTTNDLAALSDTLLYEFPRTSSGCASFLKECSKAVNKGMKDDTESNT